MTYFPLVTMDIPGALQKSVHSMNLQVRATNLQELVYKNGQAGVSKATVSITFDNKDKKQTPLGYEQYDEITVTRQVWEATFDSNNYGICCIFSAASVNIFFCLHL